MTKKNWWIIGIYALALSSSNFIFPLVNTLLGIKIEIGNWSVINFSLCLLGLLFLMDFNKKKTKVTLKRIISFVILGVGLATFFQVFSLNFFGLGNESANTNSLLEIIKKTPLFIVCVLIIIPMIEEIVYRKVIFGSIYKKKNNFIVAAAASSLLFSIVHFDFQNLLIYLVIGIIFSWVYSKTKRLIVPILSHVGMNLITLIYHL